MLDGETLTGSQITSTTGNRVATENNFTLVANTSTSATVTAFTNSSTAVADTGDTGPTNNSVDDIYYYLNVDHTTPADTYKGTVTYTAVGSF